MIERDDLQRKRAAHARGDQQSDLSTLKRLFESGDTQALSKALQDIAKADPERYAELVSAYCPKEIADAVRAGLAFAGMAEEDVRDWKRNPGRPRQDD